eukprot:Nk52_evm1s2531 gene=Nk52_evmTU1s2531
MMNDKILVAMVFCLIAVSPSLAKPVVEQEGLNKPEDEWLSFNVVKFVLWSTVFPYIHCEYPIVDCFIEAKPLEKKCEITTAKGSSCPALESKFITVERFGRATMFRFSELEMGNSPYEVPTTNFGTITLSVKDMYYVDFGLLKPPYYIALTKY